MREGAAPLRRTYLAAFIDVGGRRCVVIGGGPETEAKVRALQDAGAHVELVESFDDDTLAGCFLAIDASGDRELGARVREAADKHHVLLNVVDQPDRCDFIAPAVVHRDPLQIAISTSGRSPFMAAYVRREIEGIIGPEWGELVELVGQLRDRLRAEGIPLEEQNKIYARIPESGALEKLRAGDAAGAGAALEVIARN